MSARTVLFVDDEEGFLELYRAAFTREGLDVKTATSAETARQILAGGGIDLVVLDIRLGEDSGLALLREIKAAHPAMGVVLSTAYARYQDDFTSWLADAYVVKSSNLDELRRRVLQCLGPPT